MFPQDIKLVLLRLLSSAAEEQQMRLYNLIQVLLSLHHLTGFATNLSVNKTCFITERIRNASYATK